MADETNSAPDGKVLGRIRVYRDGDSSAPPMLIDLDRARFFGFERASDSQWRPKFVVSPDMPEHWLMKVLVKPHNGPWLLVGRSGIGFRVDEPFMYREIDRQEAAKFALSRGYVPAELRALVADRCLGDAPCDTDGDETEIKKLLRFPAERNTALARRAAAQGGDQETPPAPPAEGSGNREGAGKSLAEISQHLPLRVRQAYFAYQFAGTINEKRLEDREAYDYLKEHGLPDSAGDRGELTDYELPAFDTFTRYLREARRALGEQKYTRRANRPRGRSIAAADEIEPPASDD